MNATPLSAPSSSLPRRVRRRYVVLYTLGYFGMLLFWLLGSSLHAVWLFVPAALCALVFLVSFARIFYGVQPWNVANQRDPDLDERQQAVRNRAYFFAYNVLSAVLGVALLYWYFAGDLGWWLPRSDAGRVAIFWTLLLALISLPSAFVAWLEPDPPLEPA